MRKNLPAKMLALQRSSHYLKEVINSVKLEGVNISYLGIDVSMLI
jgi:hypothetical protein